MQDCFRLLEVRKTLICIASGLLESSGKWKQFSFIYSQSYSSLCHLFSPGQPFPFLTFMSGCCTRTTRIDFTWALERIASKFCKFEILPLLLSESSWQIFWKKKKRNFPFIFCLFLSLFCLSVLPIYHPYPIQHRRPAPSYFSTIAPIFTASVPLFSISDSYPGNEVATLESITMFLGHWWSCECLLPKGSPYSPTNHLCSLSVSHIPPPYPFLKSSYSS